MISKMFTSEAGFAREHFINKIHLDPLTTYFYEITAIGEGGFARKNGTITTLPRPQEPTLATMTQPSMPYFVAEIPDQYSYTEDVKPADKPYLTHGETYSIFVIKTKLSNGDVVAGKRVSINGVEYVSDNNGLIHYPHKQTYAKPRACMEPENATFTITVSDGVKSYSKSFKNPIDPHYSSRSTGSIACP